MKNFNDLIKMVQDRPTKTIAVAAAEDHEVLEAVIKASELKLANFILFGDTNKIKEICITHKITLPENIIQINTNDPKESAEMAVKCVNSAQADVLMKGLVDTNIILKEVLNRDYGLRTNSILSHVTIFELPKLKRIIFLTDAAMNIDPNVEELKSIIGNAVSLAKNLNFKTPKVALISAVEKVNPKMPSTLKCKELADFYANKEDVIVEGPLALDLAISKEAAITKGITGKIQGDADIIVVPYIEVGNALYKGWVFGIENVQNAGIVLGAKRPIVLTSRADSFEAKVNSIALSLLM